MLESLLILVIIALMCEAVVETLKMTFEKGKFKVDRIIALAVGVLIALVTNADLLSLTGITSKVPIVGVILTGILISRGANFIHDLISKLGVKKIE